jgi:Right handed beta helix region
MNKFRFTIHALAFAVFMIALSSAAHAQASRTWVSGVGDDANPCSRTAPCKTFAGAISKTAVNGEINCLDPGGFGAVTITKSITIDCHEVFASILNAGTNGINIPFDNFTAVGETRKTVRLRNLNFNGFDSGLIGISISGSVGTTGTKVFVEDCMLDGDFGGSATGIKDARAGGGLLNINNTTVRNMGADGILVIPSGGASSGSIKVSISNSRVSNCTTFGIATTLGSKTTIYDSVVTGNGVGLHVDSATATSTEMAVDHCVVSNNTGNGFEATSPSTTIRVSNTTAMNNGTLAAASGGGAVSSYGNNQTGGTAFPSTATSPT